MVSPDPNTTQKDTMILTNSPMASTAIPNPKTKSENQGYFSLHYIPGIHVVFINVSKFDV